MLKIGLNAAVVPGTTVRWNFRCAAEQNECDEKEGEAR